MRSFGCGTGGMLSEVIEVDKNDAFPELINLFEN